MPLWCRGGFNLFTSQVVPRLRKCGLSRAEDTGATLRDRFGLPRPSSLHGAAARAPA